MEKKGVNNQFITAANELLRRHLAKTKGELSDRLGMPQPKLSELLNGKLNVGADTLSALVTAYDISADWLLTGRGSMFSGERAIGTEEAALMTGSAQGGALEKTEIHGETDAEILLRKECERLKEDKIKLLEEVVRLQKRLIG